MADLFGVVIVRPFGILLMWIYEWVQSYGLAVILFALLVKVVLLPVSYHSKKNMLKTTALQPKLQALQKKYANNRAKLTEEMNKLYEKEGVNPMSGCLPTMIPLFIMMGLYYAVQKPLTFMMGLSHSSIELLGGQIGMDVATEMTKNIAYQINIAEGLNQFVDATGQFSAQITSLAADIQSFLVPLDFNFFGLNLAGKPEFSQPSILWIIPVLSGLTAFLSSYVMQKMQGNNAAQGQMKTLLYVMPLMSVYFGFLFPASIGVYWVFNNIITMIQEVALTKLFRLRHPAPAPEEETKPKKSPKTSKGE